MGNLLKIVVNLENGEIAGKHSVFYSSPDGNDPNQCHKFNHVTGALTETDCPVGLNPISEMQSGSMKSAYTCATDQLEDQESIAKMVFSWPEGEPEQGWSVVTSTDREIRCGDTHGSRTSLTH